VAEFAQQVVSGLAAGSIYASLALALVLIYRSTDIVNFAQGEMATFTTFVAWSLMNNGFSYWPAFALTLVIAFLGGAAVERTLIRPPESRLGPITPHVKLALGDHIPVIFGVVWDISDLSYVPGMGKNHITALNICILQSSSMVFRNEIKAHAIIYLCSMQMLSAYNWHSI
jgi:branched-subunit amino acid ABC-type transport system permease component